MNEEFSELDKEIFENTDKTDKIVLKNVPANIAKAGIINRIINKNDRNGKVINIVESKKDSKYLVFIQMADYLQASSLIREINYGNQFRIKAELCKNRFTDDSEDYRNQIIRVQQSVQDNIENGINVINEEVQDNLQISESKIDFEGYSYDYNSELERVVEFRFHSQKSSFNQDEMTYFMDLKQKMVQKKLSFHRKTMINLKFKNCSQCDSNANFIDENHERFCSKTCYESKYSLNPPPIPFVINYDDELKEKDQVKISAIINEKCLYVKKVNNEEGPLMIQVKKHAEKSKQLRKKPTKGNFVIALYEDDYYRAKVISVVDSSKIIVRLFDFGNTIQLDLDDLYEMNTQCLAIKCQTFKIILENVEIQYLNSRIVSYLNRLKYDDNIEIVISKINGNNVILKELNSSTTINDTIMQFENLQLEMSENFEDYEFHMNLCNENSNPTKFFVVNNSPCSQISNILVVYEESLMKNFYELYKTINAYGNQYKTKWIGSRSNNGQTCLVKYNEQFHRGILLETKYDGRPDFLLIDLMKIVQVPVKDIFELPEVLEKPEAFCYFAKVNDETYKNTQNFSYIELNSVIKFSKDIDDLIEE